jgi:hypothetical protein
MAVRADVIQLVRDGVFEGISSVRVPEDATVYEETEGVVSYALQRLTREVGSDSPVSEVHAIVRKYQATSQG